MIAPSRFRKKILFSLWLAVLPLAGCWDRIEVNDLILITAAALDKPEEDKGVELSIQVFIPRGGGGEMSGMKTEGSGGDENTFVRSAVGVTLADAMAKLQEKLPRRIFWGHNEVLIIGEELAKEGFREHIDFWMRYTEPRERADVFVSKGKAKEILMLIPKIERNSSEVLRELAEMRTGIKVTVKDLAQMLTGESGTAALPWVEKLPSSNEEKDEKKSIGYIYGTALFKKDRMVGWINDRVTRGMLWLRNEIETALITVKPKEAEEGLVSLNLVKSNSQLIPQIQNGKWSMTVKIDTEVDVIQNTTNLEFTNPKFLQEVEKAVAKDIEDRERMALAQAREWNVDIFGFAETFHRKYPQVWKKEKDRWDQIFPEVEVKYETKVKVARLGLSTIGTTKPEEEVKQK
ncbi:Ger(x)C family spore germination protein [Thermoflavimicrobium dichotomicum]|uniref:Spore germination protein KC n=1 Tax=Thermoflavimicrobium dichotomicum TaxID=46223 RepID=A0A1I3TI93_9BACL|nr:Ger(x)C family spore germination protein [Thermoflavimicrobium dichotomicum]SFJ70898.1 spore germination protein KC [Thermoflavimicrobium dichotomicum]